MKNLKLQREIFAPMDGNYTFRHRTALSQVMPASSIAIISADDGKHFINADVNGFVTVLAEDGVHKKDEKIAEVYVKKEAGDIQSFSELAEFIDSKYEELTRHIGCIQGKLLDIERMLDDDWNDEDDDDDNGDDKDVVQTIQLNIGKLEDLRPPKDLDVGRRECKGPIDVCLLRGMYEGYADRGDPRAMCKTAFLYAKEQNYGMAYKWYLEAAEATVPNGQYNLGLLYLNGKVDDKIDYKKARRWLQKAAGEGYVSAKVVLEMINVVLEMINAEKINSMLKEQLKTLKQVCEENEIDFSTVTI